MNIIRTGTEAQEKSSRSWSPPGGTLGELVCAMRDRAKPNLDLVDPEMDAPAPFAECLRMDCVTVIAEIKRSSPSMGSLNEAMNVWDQSAAFEKGGARAISVLTEPSRFGGSISDIELVQAACNLAILKKDFHLNADHIRDARALGCSAALLIVRAVPPDTVRECILVAMEVGIDLLVEVHRQSELELAIEAGATIIGVNARNLETLEMDSGVHGRLLPQIPANIMAVAESGMSTASDVERAAKAGADAVLIGSSLSKATDPSALVRSLTTVKRRRDVRPD